MTAIALVLVVVFLSLIVTRVATIALTLTGLSRQSARFQARSALTGVGFTTSESESIVGHPVRRRIVMTLMLIGSAGIVSVLAGLVLGFVNNQGFGETTVRLAVLVVGLGGLLFLFSRPRVDRALQRVIRRVLRRYTDLDVRDYAALLHVHGDYAVSELRIEEHSWLAGHSLRELRLNDEGVLCLGVQRQADYIGAPTGETRCLPGDVLVLYGHAERLADLDQRPPGAIGERAHAAAVGRQRLVEAEQRRAEAEPPVDGTRRESQTEPRETAGS